MENKYNPVAFADMTSNLIVFVFLTLQTLFEF